MFEKIKKFFSIDKIMPVKIYNEDIVYRLYSITQYENLNAFLTDTVNRLYILNVYHSSFNDLLSNLVSKVTNQPSMSGVNIYSYFNGINDPRLVLEKIIPILEKNNINMRVKYDLTELIECIEFLLSTEL